MTTEDLSEGSQITLDAATFTLLRESPYSRHGVPVSTGERWRSNDCGRGGLGRPGTRPNHWSEACRRGHSACPWCGRTLVLRLDGTPRVHAKCTERPADVELLRTLSAEVSRIAREGLRGPMTAEAMRLIDLLEGEARAGRAPE